MAEIPGSHTSLSLLERLRSDPRDDSAWREFVGRYRPKIFHWCREGGLQEADAEDVTQIVLAKLAETMRNFHYDPTRSFRAWLKTVTQHTWSNFLSSQRRGTGSGDSHVLQRLLTLEARADLSQRLAEAFDQEVLAVALEAVRGRVAEHTWEAFRLTTLEGLTGQDAAQRLSIPVAHVFVAKHRVQKLLRDEIQRLEGGPESHQGEGIPLPPPTAPG
jgi:RNA polymerase sigma-70 factor (ECF subfamily)